jgi:ATP-binding protein involved in chromosome partitioning
MSFFTPPDMPDKRYYIFGQDGARQLATKLEIPFLGELPIVQGIREAGDVGRPAVLQEDTPAAKAFSIILDNFVEEVNAHVAVKESQIQ